MPIMFFAAGLGTRMGTLVKNRPKPLISVGETTLLDHARAFASPDVFSPQVINVHFKADMIKEHVSRTGMLISDETNALLETGGGLKKALPLLSSDVVATMNTDAVWRGPNPLTTVLDAWDPDRMTSLLLLASKPSSLGHPGKGDFLMDGESRLTRGPNHIYTGVQITKTRGLYDMPEGSFSMNLYWNQVAKDDGLFGVLYDGQWCDVGRPTSLPLAEELLTVDI